MKVALFGAGRIGQIHAANIANHARSSLAAISDPYQPNAQSIHEGYGAEIRSEEEIFADPEIDAVLLASSTDQHARQIEAAASAGKAIFCEKPIDLDLSRVNSVLTHLKSHPVPFMLGFNRRFDPNFMALKAQIEEGAIGEIEMLTIISRDPGLPPIDYIKVSGGIFRDMMIHDFDIARWIVNEEFTEVKGLGAVHVNEDVGAAGDVDTAVASLKSESGVLVSITNSRRASYGYDQRVEVHGSKGMVSIGNIAESSMRLSTAQGIRYEKPLHFFLERYHQSYKNEWDGFVRLVLDQDGRMPTAQDGLKALQIAEKARSSAQGPEGSASAARP